jgi:hypothetical protein
MYTVCEAVAKYLLGEPRKDWKKLVVCPVLTGSLVHGRFSLNLFEFLYGQASEVLLCNGQWAMGNGHYAH